MSSNIHPAGEQAAHLLGAAYRAITSQVVWPMVRSLVPGPMAPDHVNAGGPASRTSHTPRPRDLGGGLVVLEDAIGPWSASAHHDLVGRRTLLGLDPRHTQPPRKRFVDLLESRPAGLKVQDPRKMFSWPKPSRVFRSSGRGLEVGAHRAVEDDDTLTRKFEKRKRLTCH